MEKTKQIALAKLNSGMLPREVADELKLSVSTVFRWNAELKDALLEGNIDELLQLSEEPVIEEKLSDLVDPNNSDGLQLTSESVKGLARLDESLQNTALLVNTRLRTFISTCDNVNELDICTDILCSLQNAFFNKNSTQVNVQNNFGSSEVAATSKYNAYLGDAPGVVNESSENN